MDKTYQIENQARYTEKTRQLLAQMSLKEKIALMSGRYGMLAITIDTFVLGHYNRKPAIASGNQRLKIPEMKFCDGPRGVVCGNSTCFPVAMQRGASFDVELEERIGQAIGKEIRAHGGNFFGGVCINLLRHPAGGRAQETFGEDPFHVGLMASATVRGVQKHNVIACVKHFALNNQENTRFKVNVECDERVLREVYLPHFKDVIETGAGSVMSAYNKFRGEHLGHQHYLLSEVLKKEWGFSGFVISDFLFGVRDTVKAANAGLDIEMCNTHFYGRNLVRAVERGEVPLQIIDEAALRIVRTLLLFREAPDPLPEYPPSLIASQEHRALALEAAEKSIVLLKNERSVLPFARSAVKKVLVLGRLGDTANIGDHGSSRVHPPNVVTPLQGLRKQLGPDAQVTYSDGENLNEARRLAVDADAIVIVVGCTHKDEGEFVTMGAAKYGGDRASLDLSKDESALIRAVAPLNPKTVVVLIGGSAILMEGWKETVPAILHAFYPGMEGGTALAKILFGSVNPSGKLPFSIPSDARHLPEFNRFSEQVHYDLYHGYTRLEKEGNEPAFAFGFGLSYTSFSLGNPVFCVKDNEIVAQVEVANTGTVFGEQVIQMYVGFENSAVDRPKKLLHGFTKIGLAPRESQIVTIRCPLDRLRWYNPESREWELERMVYAVYIGTSSRKQDLLAGEIEI
jgi:beta-glucosidase